MDNEDGFWIEVLALICTAIIVFVLITLVSGCAASKNCEGCDPKRSLITGDPLPMCIIDCTATITATNSEGSTITGTEGAVSVSRPQAPSITESRSEQSSIGVPSK